MPSKKQLEEDSWLKRLSSAIVYQAFFDWMQGNMGLYDSNCIPANASETMCEFFVNDTPNFFKSQYCKDLTDLDCLQLATQVRDNIPAFVEAVKVTRPGEGEATADFECPNCGNRVTVRWVDKKNGILKAKCHGCMFQTVYHVPWQELLELRSKR